MTRFAAVQMNSGDDPSVNLQQAGALLRRAADDGADLAVLPENFACMPADQASRRSAAEADGRGPLQDHIAAAADRLGLWIVAGTIPISSSDPLRPYSACCVYDDHGNRVGRFDKLHLFDVNIPGSTEAYRESEFTMAGEQPVLIESPWGRLGIAVCYDLRFPELFRRMSRSGLDFLAVPAAFTVTTGQAHWEILLRARAVENLCYLVAAAQTGVHPGCRETYGHSMLVGPWGDVLQDAGTDESVISAAIAPDDQCGLRRNFPVLDHRRDADAE